MHRLIRILTLAPGHFHAALVHKEANPGVHPRVFVYGLLDADTLQHVERLRQFNARAEQPTHWEVNLCAGEHYLERFQQQAPGNTVVIAGRNRTKIDLMLSAARMNLDILADKPWIVHADDFPKLQQLYDEVDLRDLVVWDMMTERFDLLNRLQRKLMHDPEIFGQPLVGSPDYPTLTLESIHYLKKTVAGQPLIRPVWWFDPEVAGTGLTDVGTHLADLAMWLLFPDQAIDYRQDIRIQSALNWPTMLDADQFEKVTGVTGFPPELHPYLHGDILHYAGNGRVEYTLRGAHIRLTTLWDYESPDDAGDLHEASALGSKTQITVRTTNRSQVLTITPRDQQTVGSLFSLLSRRCYEWQDEYPGLSVYDRGSECELRIPATQRTYHEQHFQSVLQEFIGFFSNSRRVPAWERPNLLAKYWLTTQAELLASSASQLVHQSP